MTDAPGPADFEHRDTRWQPKVQPYQSTTQPYVDTDIIQQFLLPHDIRAHVAVPHRRRRAIACLASLVAVVTIIGVVFATGIARQHKYLPRPAIAGAFPIVLYAAGNLVLELKSATNGSTIKTLVTSPDLDSYWGDWPALSSDGRWVYYIENVDNDTSPDTILSSTLLRIPAAGGSQQRLVTVTNGTGLSDPMLSPNGRLVAYLATSFSGPAPASSLGIADLAAPRKDRVVPLTAADNVVNLGGWAGTHELYTLSVNAVGVFDISTRKPPRLLYSSANVTEGGPIAANVRPGGSLLVGYLTERPDGFIVPKAVELSPTGKVTPITGIDAWMNYEVAGFSSVAGSQAMIVGMYATCGGGIVLRLDGARFTRVTPLPTCGP